MDAIIASYTYSEDEDPDHRQNHLQISPQPNASEDCIKDSQQLNLSEDRIKDSQPLNPSEDRIKDSQPLDPSKHHKDLQQPYHSQDHVQSSRQRNSSEIVTKVNRGTIGGDMIMPYIPKAKRAKIECEKHGKDKNDFSNAFFKRAKSFSKENILHYHAPEKRFVNFDAHQGPINKISWNPSFQDFLLSASMDGLVKVWNVESKPSCLREVNFHTQAVKDAKWSDDGLKILSGGYDKYTRIIDVSSGKEVSANKHNSFVSCVLYHPSDPNMYLSGTSNDGIFSWDLRTQQFICRYKSFFGQIQDLAFLPDGQSFISAAEISRRNSTDKGIMVWDYKTSTVLSNQVFQEAYTCTALQIHPNDSVFLAQCNAGYIAVFSQKPPYKLNKYKRYEGHSVSGYHIGIDISPDGCLIATGSSDGLVYIYNYRASNIIKNYSLDSQPCMDVAWSPIIPSLLASCDWSGKIFLHK
ncbi:WD repeat-containing protein 25-like [Dendronephthya gigantea]|uniref:WD repeat-containing protein 25-like n=1 Tax=Dendronephthya gigantea TaxID=151771 RepID=UPI001069405E|nr:WD repeat-containing protein 25-like [Dendronephthya gigantea]XP_028418909.1 WD repeat-containing protein 25-like [Dendronephthya gigantea]